MLHIATAFFEENYVDHLLRVVDEHAKKMSSQPIDQSRPRKRLNLSPRVAPSIADNHTETATRESLLERCTEVDLQTIEELVTAKYKAELSTISTTMRNLLPAEPSPDYWDLHYYEVMASLPTVRLQPKVHPGTNIASAAERAERHAILERSSKTDLKKAEEEILKRFKYELDRVPSTLRRTLPSEPTEEY